MAALPGELTDLVDSFISELRDRVDRLVADGSARELAVAVQQIERAVRAADGASAHALDAVDRRGLFVEDGHHDAKAWTRATVHVAPVDAARRHRLARFGRHNPQAADALSGRLGVAKANQLALTWSNPRVRERLEGRIGEFLDEAIAEPFDVFKARVDEWERARPVRDAAGRSAA